MKKKRLILIISILLVVVVLGLATSYSLFTYNVTKNTNFKLVIGTLELKIENTQTEDKIIMENVVPTKDSEGIKQEGYTFTIKNTGTMDSYYTVYLDDILLDGYGERLDNSYVKLNVLNHKSNQSKTTRLSTFEGDRVIASGILEKGKNITYTVKMWVDYKAGNDAQNKYFSTQIRVVGEQVNAVVYQDKVLNGTDPVLTDNLVPVKIDDKGVATKANIEEEWYSYEDKKWANAIVLKTPTEVIGENNIYGAIIEDNIAYFDGKDDYIDLGYTAYDFGQNITLAVDFKLNDLSVNNNQVIFGNWENAGGGFYYKNNKLYGGLYIRELGSYVYLSTPFNDTSNYHTAVLMYDGDYINFYIDGELVGENNVIGTIKVSWVPFYLGANPNQNGNSEFIPVELSNVNIKEYAIYNKSFSQDYVVNNMKDDIKVNDSNGLLSYGDFSNTFENNEIIPESSIESYFVWIPKYSYQLWDLGTYSNLTAVDSTKPHAIPIKFETTNTSDSNSGECTTPGVAGESGNCKVGDYMTHPAFLAFDSTGFWVGKFETGYDGATSAAEAHTDVNIVDINKVIIKPNVYSWRNINIGNMFQNSYEYLRTDESHMMKNTEWGAVAYLSHSNYGINKEIRINNNINYITGYAATEVPTIGYNNGESVDGNRVEATSIGVDGTYTINYLNTLSQNASTTGNYTGIYDMSGGSWEYIMGYTTASTTVGGSSDITTLYSDFFTNSNWDKYYDKYTSSSNLNYNNRILGDATGEMGPFFSELDPDENKRNKSSWYGDYGHIVHTTSPWVDRGANLYNGTVAGIFTFHHNTGDIYSSFSYRIVLTPTK